MIRRVALLALCALFPSAVAAQNFDPVDLGHQPVTGDEP